MLSRHFQHKETYVHPQYGHDDMQRADTQEFNGLHPGCYKIGWPDPVSLP